MSVQTTKSIRIPLASEGPSMKAGTYSYSHVAPYNMHGRKVTLDGFTQRYASTFSSLFHGPVSVPLW